MTSRIIVPSAQARDGTLNSDIKSLLRSKHSRTMSSLVSTTFVLAELTVLLWSDSATEPVRSPKSSAATTSTHHDRTSYAGSYTFMKLTVTLTDDTGAEWRVTDWRSITNRVYQRVATGDPLGTGRLFVNVATGERRYFLFPSSNGRHIDVRTLLVKQVMQQLAAAAPATGLELETAPGQWNVDTAVTAVDTTISII